MRARRKVSVSFLDRCKIFGGYLVGEYRIVSSGVTLDHKNGKGKQTNNG